MFSALSQVYFSNSSHLEMASETLPVRDSLNYFSTIFGKGLNKQKFDLARSQTSDSSLPSHEWDNPMNKLAYIENSVWKRTCVMSNVNSSCMHSNNNKEKRETTMPIFPPWVNLLLIPLLWLSRHTILSSSVDKGIARSQGAFLRFGRGSGVGVWFLGGSHSVRIWTYTITVLPDYG